MCGLVQFFQDDPVAALDWAVRMPIYEYRKRWNYMQEVRQAEFNYCAIARALGGCLIYCFCYAGKTSVAVDAPAHIGARVHIHGSV